MLFKFSIAIFLTVTSLATSASPDPVKEIEKTRQVHKITGSISTIQYTLPNGLNVFLTENPKAPNVVVSHWVKAGSLHERPGITGIAHLFEHMMFRPITPGAPSFFDIVTKLGGDANANTRFESTFYYTIVPRKHLKTLLKHESERFKKLVVTKELLDVERKAVWSEYSTKFDANPVIDLWFQIYQRAYKGHPFGWMIIGERDDLEKITAKDCNEFFKKYYRPNNIGLFITGDFKASEILPAVIENYSDWERGTDSQLPPPFKGKTKEIIAEGKLPAEAKVMLFGFRTPYVDAANATIQSVAATILFDSQNGLLRKRLVDQTKLASSVGEFNGSYDNGMMKASIVLLPSTTVKQVRNELVKALDDLKAMSDETFATYKRNYYVSIAESNLRNSNIAGWLPYAWGKLGDIKLASTYLSAPLDVTKEQVLQFLSEYYKPDNFIIMVHKGQAR